MRVFLVLVMMMAAFATKAQNVMQAAALPYAIGSDITRPLPHYDTIGHSKWTFSKYISLSTGYSFFRGGNAFFVAAPIGVQVNRSLSNHFTAFAGASVAPLYFNFNSAFAPNAFTKTNAGNSFLKTNNLGMYSKVEMGLVYTNDAKTFSISGSIGVQKSSAPVFYPAATSNEQNPQRLSSRHN